MRPLRHDDITAAARLLWSLPRGQHRTTMHAMLTRARWADAYRKRLGKRHPFWGDGSLGGAARTQSIPPEPPLSDAAYQGCLAMVLMCCLFDKPAQNRLNMS